MPIRIPALKKSENIKPNIPRTIGYKGPLKASIVITPLRKSFAAGTYPQKKSVSTP